MGRRKYTREFKLEAIGLIKERGVSIKEAGRDMGIHENTLRAWLKEFEADPQDLVPFRLGRPLPPCWTSCWAARYLVFYFV